MAEIRKFPEKTDILTPLAQGAQIAGGIQNIRASQARVDLARQQQAQQAQQQQFVQEQAIKQQEQQKLTRQLDRTDKLIDAAIKNKMMDKNPEFLRKLVDSSNAISSQLFPDSPNYDFDTILNNKDEFEKDWNAYQLMINEGMQEEANQFLNEIFPKYRHDPTAVKGIAGAQKAGAERLVAGQKERIARQTFIPSRFPDATPEQLATAGQIALESSVEKGAEYIRQVAEEDEDIKFIKVSTISEDGDPVTAFLDPVSLETVKEIPREGKATTKAQIVEVGLPNFPNWMQKAEVTTERDDSGNLILKPVGSPFQKEAQLRPSRIGKIPIGIGGETEEVAGPPQQGKRGGVEEPSVTPRVPSEGRAPRKADKGFAPRTTEKGKVKKTPLIKVKEYMDVSRSGERYKQAIEGLSKKDIKKLDDRIIKIWADLFNEGKIPIGANK